MPLIRYSFILSGTLISTNFKSFFLFSPIYYSFVYILNLLIGEMNFSMMMRPNFISSFTSKWETSFLDSETLTRNSEFTFIKPKICQRLKLKHIHFSLLHIKMISIFTLALVLPFRLLKERIIGSQLVYMHLPVRLFNFIV